MNLANLIIKILPVLIMSIGYLQAMGQQINLDKPLDAGKLKLFPDREDDLAYYYLVDQPRLAIKDGKPQFSFLRYVENEYGEGSQGQSIAQGGGLFHAVVELHVSEDDIKKAAQDLQRKIPGAKILGGISPQSGTFSLISSIADENGGFTDKVIGIGNAPLLNGHQAAVSFQVNKKGALLLWESLQMNTGDISFRFEIVVGGYRMPKKATVEINWDKVYKNRKIEAAVASPIFGAEIESIYNELRTSGAIKVETVDTDENMDNLITTAYQRMADQMFEQIAMPPEMTNPTNQMSAYDRATAMLNKLPTETKTSDSSTDSSTPVTSGSSGTTPTTGNNTPTTGSSSNTPTTGTGNNSPTTSSSDSTTTGSSSNTPTTGNSTPTENSDNPTSGTTTGGDSGDSPATVDDSPTTDSPEAIPSSPPARTRSSSSSRRRSRSQSTPSEGGSSSIDSNSKMIFGSPNKTVDTKALGQAKIAAFATFKLKKTKQSGVHSITLTKWSRVSQPYTFSKNIGDLSKYVGNPKFFREINLNDPLYIQREVFANLNGSADDFENYINYVTVMLEKKHATGKITHDEIRITSENYQDETNRFAMLYGWNGDKDRSKWMDFEYKVQWSFFGDLVVDIPLTKSSSNTIPLTPPYRRKTIEAMASSSTVDTEEIRLITINIHYKIADKEFSKQLTINPMKSPSTTFYSVSTDILDKGDLSYDYEIIWRLKGGREINSGRFTSTESVLLVDELPVQSN